MKQTNLKLTEEQIESLASAIYTQIDALRSGVRTVANGSRFEAGAKRDIKNLRAVLKKLSYSGGGRSL